MCFGNTLGFVLGASKDIASSVLVLMGLKYKLDEERMADVEGWKEVGGSSATNLPPSFGWIEGDFTWSSLSGRTVRLTPVAIQSLSELERARLQEVAFNRLVQDYDLGCQITMPKEFVPQAFSIPLSQVIANDRAHRQRQDSYRFDLPQREEQKDSSDLVSSILQVFNLMCFRNKRDSACQSDPNSWVFLFTVCHQEAIEQGAVQQQLFSEFHIRSQRVYVTQHPRVCTSSPQEGQAPPSSSPTPSQNTSMRRFSLIGFQLLFAPPQGGMSVDSITDLDDNQSRLLEALQLSLPAETPNKKEKHRDKRLSLNPIYRQVPRVVDSCCQHIEKYGLQTVGIFRVGSSKKRVRQLREEFDRGIDVQLDEEHSIHDVAALLKEFLRDMPDPLLTKELYTPLINTTPLEPEEQQSVTQLLIYLLPACNSDTLYRLLEFLSNVADHANDRHDKEGEEMTGNKMTSLNLATIFGPNLLHKQKNSDKEFSVQSSARAEESTAVIAVLQKMIASYQSLFMVPPDLQNEVLMNLMETDPDVVDYLLRRKASQSPDLLQSEEPFNLSEHHSSTDSNKASSGEVSPYDNNSPVLSERRGESGSSPGEQLANVPENYSEVGQETDSWGSKEEHANIWGTWHSTLKPALKSQSYTGSHGNMSEGSSRSSQEGLDGLHGDIKQQTSVQQPTTTPGTTEYRPHTRVTRVCTGTPLEAGHPRLQLTTNSPVTNLNSRHGIQRPTGHGSTRISRSQGVGNTGKGVPSVFHQSPPPYTAHHRMANSQSSPQLSQQPPQQSNSASAREAQMVPQSQEWQDWQRERWQIWQLLSSDNADTLPETLV
uniref:Rho GTPase activating protein 6 n=1 Tax=Oryzias latipes TaxID=8090 RepID=A0A3P9L9D1_ORYLA